MTSLAPAELGEGSVPLAKTLLLPPPSKQLVLDLQEALGRLQKPRQPRTYLLEEPCSSISERANARAEGLFHAVSPQTKTVQGLQADPEGREKELKAKYQELVYGIEAALTGSFVTAALPLHAGDVHVLKLESDREMVFVVPLPRQAVEVSVHLAVISGGRAELFGSVENIGKANARFYDFKGGEDGTLFYRHEPAVEAHNSLFVGVAADAVGCEFRLRCLVRRSGKAARNLSASERVVLALNKLRSDPVARRDFEFYLEDLKQRQVKKSHSGPKDFQAKNHKVEECSPQAKQARQRAQSARNAERRSLVERRREEVQRAAEERLTQWLAREEVLRRQREVEETQQHLEHLEERRVNEWHKLMLKTICCVQFAKKIHWDLEHKKLVDREIKASAVLQGFIMTSLTRKRRKELYLNLIRLRTALVTMTRTLRPAALVAAQPRVTWLLNRHVEKRAGQMEIMDVIHYYRQRVIMIQEGWRRWKRRLQARCFAMMRHFLASYFVKEYWDEVRAKEASKALGEDDAASVASHRSHGSAGSRRGSSRRKTLKQPDVTALKGRASSAAKSSVRKSVARKSEARPASKGSSLPLRRPPTATGNSPLRGLEAGPVTVEHMPSVPAAAGEASEETTPRPKTKARKSLMTFRLVSKSAQQRKDPAFVVDYNGEELLPEFLRRRVVRQQLVEQMKSYRGRLLRWRELREAHGMELELATMGWVDLERLEAVRNRPKQIDLSKFRDVYSETYDKLKSGAYKPVLHHRARLMRKVLQYWHRVLERPADIGDLALAAEHMARLNRQSSTVSTGSNPTRSARGLLRHSSTLRT